MRLTTRVAAETSQVIRLGEGVRRADFLFGAERFRSGESRSRRVDAHQNEARQGLAMPISS